MRPWVGEVAKEKIPKVSEWNWEPTGEVEQSPASEVIQQLNHILGLEDGSEVKSQY